MKVRSKKMSVRQQINLTIFIIAIILVAAATALLIPKFKGETLTNYLIERAAHTNLTDGTKASSSPDDPNWVTLYADSNQLPKTAYHGHEFQFWGTTSPHSTNPGRNLGIYAMLRDANIRGVRLEMAWNGLMQYRDFSKSVASDIRYGHDGMEDNINTYVNDGVSIIGLLNSTPAWANGHRYHAAPPSVIVEGENLDLTTGTGQVVKTPMLYNQEGINRTDPIVIPSNSPTARIDDEILTNNYSGQDVLTTAQRPIIPETVTVWIDEKQGAGFEQWTRVERLIESPDNAKHYMADFRGRIMFRFGSYFNDHGKVPTGGSSIKISYTYYTKRYMHGIDYTYNNLTGTFNAQLGDLSVGKQQENFDNTTLDSAWKWMDEPTKWDVNTTKPGKLHVTLPKNSSYDDRGSFLYQESSGSGDFIMHLKIDEKSWQPDCDLNEPYFSWATGGCDDNKDKQSSFTQTGPMVYQDENNWFRIALSQKFMRGPMVIRKENGQITYYETPNWFNILPPRWLNIRKSGNQYYLYYSNEPAVSGHLPYQFTNTFNGSLKFGISFVGLGHANNPEETTTISEMRIFTPEIINHPQVKVFYQYLDTEVWKEYAYNVVNYYKDRIKYWEIWNEPDQGWVWSGGYDLMAYMTKAAYEAIKLADPEAVVIGSGYANDNAARGGYGVMYNLIGNQYVDALAYHPYLFKNIPPDNVGWKGNSSTRNLMLAQGDADKKVFFTEISSTSGVTAWDGGMNERKQVDYGIRMGMFGKKLGWVGGFSWWPTVDMNRVGEEESFGYGGHDGLFYRHWIDATLATRTNNIVTIHTEAPHLYQPGDTIFFELFKNAFGTANRTVLSVPTPTTFTFEMVGQDSSSLWLLERSINGLFPKPMYWGYRNLATNRGILLDLVNYDSSDNPVPAARKYSIDKVKLSTLKREDIQSIKVLTSLTATDDSSRPRRVAARRVGQTNGDAPFVVDIDFNSSELKSEKWLATAITTTQFTVVGDLSGNQGTATVGQQFNSNNNLLKLTIPTSITPYAVGHSFEFETFAGDGFRELTTWQNDGSLQGRGEIEISLPTNTETRYVALHLVKATGVSEIKLDEVEVIEAGTGQNVAQNKIYLVDGYQEHFNFTEPENKPVIDIITPESGDTVTSSTVFVTYRVDGTTKSQQFTLTAGENTLEITEENPHGVTTVTLTIYYAQHPVVTIPDDLQGKIVDSANLTVNYTHDGQAKSANFSLNRGRNDLSITETNFGLQTTKTFTVYYVAGDRSFPTERIVRGINMIAFPYVNETSFSDLFSTPNYSPLRRIDPTDGKEKSKILAYNGQYIHFTPSPSAPNQADLKPTAGQGYFMRLYADESFDHIKYYSQNIDKATINLNEGWNMLGNPFDQDMSPTKFTIIHNGQAKNYQQAVNEQLIVDYFYTWERAEQVYKFITINPKYDSQPNRQTVINPYRGFWLYARVSGLTIEMHK